ncbi:sensor domain-containing diguanylate cyclase [Sedimenticola hydrogenitrophicus]|uniref:sensor domain-containing diguanylate cyclase n=1 Tax=Sedimenticola hydrogenitrophicus TaxID=2967975 RepID=UPI0021A89347|nr:sensor domain-containing diguanylate cyclase [Sedimenticola hydrogenitrophicus]
MAINLINNELALICPDPVIGINRDGIITLFNPAAEQLLGYPREEMVGRFQIAELYSSPESAREIKRLMYQTDHGPKGQLIGHKTHLQSRSGELIPIQLSATLIEKHGKEIGSIGFFRDLTERLALERSLKLLSVTDSLTGLYNQRHFHTVLNQEIARSKRYSHPLSLVCIDLDNFKSVNDTLGHVEGDLALRYVGEAINGILRNSDYGFRYGGDEFMVLLPETPQQSTHALTLRLIDYFARHMPSNLVELAQVGNPVALSIGIAEYKDDEPAGVFIKRTDLAMYQAKKQPGSLAVLAE